MLTTADLNSLTLGRYEFHLRACVDAVFPPFLGTTLRGAFGHALKAIACSMPHGDCSRCFLVNHCLYPRLFETRAKERRQVMAKQDLSMMNFGGTDRGVARSAVPRQPIHLLKPRQDAPRPFIFIPPIAGKDDFIRACDDLLRWRIPVKAGDSIAFGLSLFGSAIRELPYIIHAISMMAHHGFGVARLPFVLEKVLTLDSQGNRKTIYSQGTNYIEEHDSSNSTLGVLVQARLEQLVAKQVIRCITVAGIENQKLAGGASYSALNAGHSALEKPIRDWQSAIGNEVTLHFLTPTRLRVEGRVVEQPSLTQLVRSVSLRLAMLAEVWGNAAMVYDYKATLERTREISPRESNLRLMALDRFSRRQGKLDLDGFMGQITFAGPSLWELLPLLVAGEFVHAGSGTAFGLGKYKISEND
jgi:hypothetical protein